jgi:hypothetical protein
MNVRPASTWTVWRVLFTFRIVEVNLGGRGLWTLQLQDYEAEGIGPKIWNDVFIVHGSSNFDYISLIYGDRIAT